MAVAVHLDPDTLTAQATALDERAAQLRAEARDLSNQAIDLRLEVERMGREPVRLIHRKGISVERDARFLAVVGDTLGKIGPCKSSHLAEHLNASQQRVYQALVTLEKSGAVKRSGIRRGTVWAVVDDEDLNGHAPIASARTLVLEAGQKLGVFDYATINDALQMLSDNGVRRALQELVADGCFSEVKDGNRKIYAFERPEPAVVNRPKHEPPEAKVIEMARKTPLPRRGQIVEGTGQRHRSGSPIVDELLRELADWPIVKISKHAHSYRFKIDGKTIASCPSTPKGSGMAEVRRHLRKAGIELRER